MIFGKNLKSIYEKNKEAFRDLVVLDQNKPIGFDEMEYTFSSLGGKKYYSFPESTAIPIVRLAKIQEYNVLMSSGLSNGVISELTDKMDNILASIVNTGFDAEVKKNSSKNIANLGLLIHEIRDRQNSFIPVELYFGFLACQMVREDENPYSYNEQVQLDKIAELKDLNDKIGGFFFGQKELKRLGNFANMSIEEWSEYWRNSMAFHEIKQKALMTYLSAKS